jgi:hypothetical protein
MKPQDAQTSQSLPDHAHRRTRARGVQMQNNRDAVWPSRTAGVGPAVNFVGGNHV